MEEFYNEYTYQINTDLSINILNRCYKNSGILDPEITVNEDLNAISFDFGWHIFELYVQDSTFLIVAVKENSIGLHGFKEDDGLPFNIVEKDKVFVGLLNVNIEDLVFVPLVKPERFLISNRGKLCLPLANNYIEYFACPTSEVMNEHYRLRVLVNNDTEKGALLIQRGSEGFCDNILSPMLNQINLNNSSHTEIFMVQNNITQNIRNSDEDKSERENYSLEKKNNSINTDTVASNEINETLEFFNKIPEVIENANNNYDHWFNLFFTKTLFFGKSFFLLLVSLSVFNLFISIILLI